MSADTISLMSAPTKKPIARVVNTVERAVGRRDLVLARKGVRDSVVSLAGLLGCPVTNEDGREIGRLVDVVVKHGQDAYPPVSGLIVKVGLRRSFIDGARIAKLERHQIKLSSTTINLTDYKRRSDESLLDADVLDHQIVDVNGLRVVRSSDLYLAPLDKEIRVVGVDILLLLSFAASFLVHLVVVQHLNTFWTGQQLHPLPILQELLKPLVLKLRCHSFALPT